MPIGKLVIVVGAGILFVPDTVSSAVLTLELKYPNCVVVGVVVTMGSLNGVVNCTFPFKFVVLNEFPMLRVVAFVEAIVNVVPTLSIVSANSDVIVAVAA